MAISHYLNQCLSTSVSWNTLCRPQRCTSITTYVTVKLVFQLYSKVEMSATWYGLHSNLQIWCYKLAQIEATNSTQIHLQAAVYLLNIAEHCVWNSPSTSSAGTKLSDCLYQQSNIDWYLMSVLNMAGVYIYICPLNSMHVNLWPGCFNK